MSRRLRISQPPLLSADFHRWALQVTNALNALNNVSIFSSADPPNTSGLTASVGDIAINIGSHASKLWFSASSATNAWSYISYS